MGHCCRGIISSWVGGVLPASASAGPRPKVIFVALFWKSAVPHLPLFRLWKPNQALILSQLSIMFPQHCKIGKPEHWIGVVWFGLVWWGQGRE